MDILNTEKIQELPYEKNSTENVWRVLGLESSCDTAASVLKIVDNNKEKKLKYYLPCIQPK